MYEIEESKYDFARNSSSSLCQACLSSDRSLTSIGEYVDIFRNISNNVIPQPLLLCWECTAILKKIKLFKEKLEEAQRILAYHYLNKQKLFLQTLSKLTKTCTDHTIIITYDNDDDCKQKLEIKQENQHSDDSFNDFDENDFSLQEIKKEKAIDTKVRKKHKSLHYRIVYEKNAKRGLKKKFGIQPDELNLWMDRERNSDFYKKFKYKCKFCVNGFNSSEKLKSHILKYHDESVGSHVCPSCSIRFANESLLNAHARAHEFAWECARCGFQCYTVKRLNAHINTHSAVQCIFCEGTFKDLATFYTHYKSLHSIFLCDHCGKRCKTKYMLEKHMSRHLDTHICLACSRQYKSHAALRKHYFVKHSACVAEQAYCVLCDKHRHLDTHICLACSRQYKSHAALRKHYFVKHSACVAEQAYCVLCDKHRHLDTHICLTCSRQYKSHAALRKHYSVKHSACAAEQAYCVLCDKHRHLDTHICLTCSRQYKSHAALRKHYSVKHSACVAEQAYCVLCDKQYESEYVYRRHVHTSAAHRKERESEANKKVPCPECNNMYSRRAYMMNHYRHVHMNQSKYFCSECDRHFLNRTRYVEHMRYNHEGIKKEKNKLCNICGRGFAANRTLLNHMRTHSGERPYECEYCGATFTQRTSMLSHVKHIHMKSKRRSQWPQ